MASSTKSILRRHRSSLTGSLRYRSIRSEALGISKGYYLYESPGLKEERVAPVLYLFRGHEREWVNMAEDDSRRRSTAIEDIDRLIEDSVLPPMLVVMPGLNSADNAVPSLGINMRGKIAKEKSLGNGRFWTFLTEELMPHAESGYASINGGERLMAGFSLGGYTVANLAVMRPGEFSHAAIYDGTLMWPGHVDPRLRGSKKGKTSSSCKDRVWCKAAIFDQAFGKPREMEAMNRWNPTDRIMEAEKGEIDQMRETTFWIACASRDGDQGNLDRARFFKKLVRQKRIPLGFSADDVILDPDASHSWHWADRFVTRFLKGVYAEDALAVEST